MNIEQATKKVMQDYDKTLLDPIEIKTFSAKFMRDVREVHRYLHPSRLDEYEDEVFFWKYAVPVFLVLALSYFIIRAF